MPIWDRFKEILGVTPVSINEIQRQTTGFKQGSQYRSVKSEDIEVTEEYREIIELIKKGAPLIFVTGKAGTGKTTFIRYLRKIYDKNLVVVAPTGVAALNIEGATIHSFFRLPSHVISDQDIKNVRDRKLYAEMSLLVIDEVSMVRADLLDAIDKFLRKHRENKQPFGGVQVLLIGDMFQLPPILGRRETEAFQLMGYEHHYFFSAKGLQSCQMYYKELTKTYRQSDKDFIDILDKVRQAEDIDKILPILNQRHKPTMNNNDTNITLTCTNRVADEINDIHLKRLTREPFLYMGEVSGKFALEDEKLPSPLNLVLKVGAQVMFTKNDDLKRWVNGTLGKVVGLTKNNIRVEISGKYGTATYDVQKVKWEAFRYQYDELKDKIVAVPTGMYIQYPLMLAWAVTIHKSQGKTLEKVRVDLGEGAFSFGQVYVALSRCRSLEDIELVTSIQKNDIKCDPVIKRFYEALCNLKDK